MSVESRSAGTFLIKPNSPESVERADVVGVSTTASCCATTVGQPHGGLLPSTVTLWTTVPNPVAPTFKS